MSSRPSPMTDDAARRGPRRVVATFDNYRDAERAVDALSDQRFPVDRVSIVGRDLRLVEQVTGRMTYGRSALHGALSGALVGALIGWLFTVFNWFDPVVARGWLILDGLWFGALAGALFGLLAHALTGGRRDFASVGGMQAEHYDVLVDEEVADEAARLLGGVGRALDDGEPRSPAGDDREAPAPSSPTGGTAPPTGGTAPQA
jgi:hypothetical protein